MIALSPSWLTPESTTVSDEPWSIACFGDKSRVVDPDDVVREWDPALDLRLHRQVVIRPAFWSQCGLGRDASVLLCASWQRQGQPIGGSAEPVVVNLDKSKPLTVRQDLIVPAGESGGVLSIRTFVLLGKRGRGADNLAATERGQLLWMSEPERANAVQLRLEGDGALFPVLGVDFTTDAMLPANAGWLLRWSGEEPDLDAQVSASFRLLVNTGIEAIKKACVSDDDEAKRLRSIMKADVARQLLSRLLKQPEDVKRPQAYSDGSLGRLLWSLIRTVDPASDPKRFAVLMREDEEENWAQLQHAFGILAFRTSDGGSETG